MSYKSYFRYGHDSTASAQKWVYFYDPSKEYNLECIQRYDRSAEHYIKDLEELISDLKEYRQDLAARYSELAAMPYSYKLYLVRDKSWSTKKVTFTVRLVRVLPDGKEIDEQKEVFSGSERKKAFERFSELKASRPGIETVQDTQKKQWEK